MWIPTGELWPNSTSRICCVPRFHCRVAFPATELLPRCQLVVIDAASWLDCLLTPLSDLIVRTLFHAAVIGSGYVWGFDGCDSTTALLHQRLPSPILEAIINSPEMFCRRTSVRQQLLNLGCETVRWRNFSVKSTFDLTSKSHFASRFLPVKISSRFCLFSIRVWSLKHSAHRCFAKTCDWMRHSKPIRHCCRHAPDTRVIWSWFRLLLKCSRTLVTKGSRAAALRIDRLHDLSCCSVREKSNAIGTSSTVIHIDEVPWCIGNDETVLRASRLTLQRQTTGENYRVADNPPGCLDF